MNIRISEIVEGGLRITTHRRPEWVDNVPELSAQDDHMRLVSDVLIDLFLTREEGEINVSGTVTFTLHALCSRCLEPVRRTLSPEVRLVLTNDVRFSEDTDSDLDVDYAYYEGEEIVLGDYLREVVAMGLPVRVLCDEGCRGLCPHCGANLNAGDCGCRSHWVDPRLVVLEKIRDQLK